MLRAGRYHETITIQGKALTVQNYPGEAAWLDGSETVTGWVQDGSVWRRDGWTTRFDHSPTYTRGATDLTAPGWQFINPNYPMAAHPDQVFVDGTPLQQVASRGQVTAGTFYVDEATSQLYLGVDPRGRTVEASTLVKAMSVRAQGTVLRGFGDQTVLPLRPRHGCGHARGATDPHGERRGCGLGNDRRERPGCRYHAVPGQTSGAGMLGLHARFADGLMVSRSLLANNNSERFNIAPVSGGMKLFKEGLTFRDSESRNNAGPGLWTDMSVYNIMISGSTFRNNAGDGVFLEISAKAIVVNNYIVGNRIDGIKVNNTSNVKIWNNTLVGNGRPLNLVTARATKCGQQESCGRPSRPLPRSRDAMDPRARHSPKQRHR